jgi:hypothetical protein
MQPRIEPTTIATHGINTVRDRYLFRAIVIEAIRATVEHVNPNTLKNELKTVYISIMKE